MYENRYEGTEDLEKLFRRECTENGDDASVLTYGGRYTYVDECDLNAIRGYGWPEERLEEMIAGPDGADEITRLAAWIRECGDVCGMTEDIPYVPADGYGLDTDGNYPECTEAI